MLKEAGDFFHGKKSFLDLSWRERVQSHQCNLEVFQRARHRDLAKLSDPKMSRVKKMTAVPEAVEHIKTVLVLI